MQTRQGPLWRWVVAGAVMLGAGRLALGQQTEPWATLKGHAKGVNSLAFSPDGRVLASGSGDGTIRLWELLTGKVRATRSGHPGGVSAVAFTPDGRMLASGGFDEVVRLWDAAGREHGSLKVKAQDKIVHCLSFSRSVSTLAVGGTRDYGTGYLRLWDVRESTNGDRGGDYGSGARVWEAASGKVSVTACSFSTDGRMLASGDYAGFLTAWEVASGKARGSFRSHGGFVSSIAFVPGGDLLALGTEDGMIRLWDVRVGKERLTLKGHTHAVYSLAIVGELLASASQDRTVRLWNTAAGEHLLALDLDAPVWSVAFSRDGKLLAAGDEKGTIRLWSVPKLLAQKGKK